LRTAPLRNRGKYTVLPFPVTRRSAHRIVLATAFYRFVCSTGTAQQSQPDPVPDAPSPSQRSQTERHAASAFQNRAARPNIAAFEKMESDRLAGARRAIDQLVAVNGPRTIENTLAPYDEAYHQLSAVMGFSGVMQEVHSIEVRIRAEMSACGEFFRGVSSTLSKSRG
jgi:hypothetical protein